ncbi:MAG: DM13 domain-containing protein [Granulosicoccus sp.]
MKRFLLYMFSHGLAMAAGFALGIYLLPILTAPDSPDADMLQEQAQSAMFTAEFTRELRGSDLLHWGEGMVSITEDHIVHEGKLAPGPDYKLYLVKDFVAHEDEFLPVKADALQIGDIKTFDGFLLDIPDGTDFSEYTTLLVWCEAFSEFITAAKYR